MKDSLGDFNLYIENGDEKFKEIFSRFISKEIESEVVAQNKYSSVYFLEFNGVKYVLKKFNENPKKKITRGLECIFFKSTARKMFDKSQASHKAGFSKVVKIYLAADKKEIVTKESYILMEFIDGIEVEKLGRLNNSFKTRLFNVLEKMHEHNIISGDPNPKNFILSKDGRIRIIDFTKRDKNPFYCGKDIGIFNRIYETNFKKNSLPLLLYNLEILKKCIFRK